MGYTIADEHIQSSIPHAVQTLDGTVQRVNYLHRELTVVARGRIWNFRLDSACQLWFDDQPTILRCFHPLDRIRIIYEIEGEDLRAKALFAWEKRQVG